MLDHVTRTRSKLIHARGLSEAEQTALLAACPKKLGKIVRLALITGARIGEILALTWDDVLTTELLLLETKNGRSRRLPRSPAIDAVLKSCVRGRSPWLFTNPRAETGQNSRTGMKKVLVDGRRLELPTSALRTRRSPS